MVTMLLFYCNMVSHPISCRVFYNVLQFNRTDLFYHFVGGTPGSTDLLAMLRRLNHDLRQTDVSCF